MGKNILLLMFLIILSGCGEKENKGNITNKNEIKVSGIVNGEILIPVIKNEKFGYINLSGKEKVEFIYDEAGEFSEGVAAVCKKE